MSMFTKALIHQNKDRQRERRRRMDDKGERETLECILEWLWTVNPYCFLLLLWLYFS